MIHVERRPASTAAAKWGFTGLFGPPCRTDTRAFFRSAIASSSAACATVTAASCASAASGSAPPEEPRGVLLVRVTRAFGLLNTDTGLFGDVSDPYVIVRAGGTEHRTPTIDNDLNPVWRTDNVFRFEVAGHSVLLDFEVMNSNVIRDDSLGRTSIDAAALSEGWWYHRRVALEGCGCGELEFQFRLDWQVRPPPPPVLPPTVSASSAPSILRGSNTKPCRFGLPSHWLFEDLERDQPTRWNSEPEHGEPHASSQAEGATLSTFAAGEAVSGTPSLDLGDPCTGPALRWNECASSAAPSTTLPADALAWAGLDPPSKAASPPKRATTKSTASLRKSMSMAQDKAREVQVRAEAELEQALRKLKELPPPVKAAVPPPVATAPDPPPVPSPATPPPASAQTKAAPVPPKAAAPPQASPLPKAAMPSPSPPTTSTSSADKLSEGGLELACNRVREVEGQLEAFKSDAAQKDYRLQIRKAANLKISQISATWSRIQESTTGLSHLVTSHAAESPTRRLFLHYYLAVRFADEAEVGIRSQPRAAWPIAQVAARIFSKFSPMEEMFHAVMCKLCPYIRAQFAGSEWGRQGLAPCQRPSEPFTEFADRMVSYQRLWLAIAVTQGSLAFVWWWLARTLNSAPTPLVGPLLHATLEAAGCDAQARYQRQFGKLVECLEKQYMPRLDDLQGKVKGEEADRLRASLSRLRRWLEAFRQTRKAAPPEGRYISTAEEAELNPNV